ERTRPREPERPAGGAAAGARAAAAGPRGRAAGGAGRRRAGERRRGGGEGRGVRPGPDDPHAAHGQLRLLRAVGPRLVGGVRRHRDRLRDGPVARGRVGRRVRRRRRPAAGLLGPRLRHRSRHGAGRPARRGGPGGGLLRRHPARPRDGAALPPRPGGARRADGAGHSRVAAAPAGAGAVRRHPRLAVRRRAELVAVPGGALRRDRAPPRAAVGRRGAAAPGAAGRHRAGLARPAHSRPVRPRRRSGARGGAGALPRPRPARGPGPARGRRAPERPDRV
ncbi:MAG: hypothetical protein AVDCRST_MAG16-1171, partial [uncultured Frankineae bacterium]